MTTHLIIECKEYPTFDLIQTGIRVVFKKIFRVDLPIVYDFKGRICSDYVRDIYLRYGILIGKRNLSVGELWRELKK